VSEAAIADSDHCTATIFDPADEDDRRGLAELRANPRIDFIDQRTQQVASLQRLRPPPDCALIAESTRWAYYPWRRAVVGVLGPRAFRALRLDRNRNMITAEEQDRLGTLRIGVIGLSVGHAIAHTLAAEGLCGELRLADFDTLELSNLNRVPATVFDLTVNKAVVAARRITELDPYLSLHVSTSGLMPHTVESFLDGLDVVVEECDSLDMKVIVREAARARRIPVLMATSDRGLVDVERYDLEPSRPILHGLIGDVDVAQLASLSSRDKVPHVLRILDAASLSPRAAASLVEVGQTLTTWPQLAGDVALGATAVAEAVRRIGLREPLASGRVRLDIAMALDQLDEPPAPRRENPVDAGPAVPAEMANPSEIVAAAAIRAPSGGNAQPWHVETNGDSVTLVLAPEHTSTMDVGFRGSAVAIGAAVFNARVAAAAHGVLGAVEFGEDEVTSPLRARVLLGSGDDPGLARLYRQMLLRETNRHQGAPRPLAQETIESLEAAARGEGGRLRLLTERDDIEHAAGILGRADRIRYLTSHLHEEMISEVRWPGDASPDSGIDVHSLELDPGELLTLDILRRPEVMANLAEWDAGAALGDDTRDRVRASSALAVISVPGHTLTDYARGGSAVEAAWIVAQQHGLGIQPISPVFLYAHDHNDLQDLSPPFAPTLSGLQRDFRELAGTGADESQVLVLRLSDAPRPSVRSRRRSLDRAHSPLNGL
jgi:molybdopterin/thiamine biosynthesis adenylyltransferase